MDWQHLTRRAFLASAGTFVACGQRLAAFPFDLGLSGPGPLGLTVHFFGVCCVLVEGFGTAVLFDPFWTHLPLRQVAFGRIAPSAEAMAPAAPSLRPVQAVLVGHSHYDHALAVPTVDPHLAPDAVFLGSDTLAHTFAPVSLDHPVVGLNDRLTTHSTVGTPWLHPGGMLRVWPIRSGHPPQWAFVHLYRRSLDSPRARPPTRAHHYQEGVTLAFLVDFLVGGVVAARVYVQSSSTGFPAGFFPAELLRERGVDLAVVAMDVANREQARGDSVLHLLRAPQVVFTHYEDFFRPKEPPVRETVKVDLPATKAFFSERTDARYWFPAWDTRLEL